MSSLTDEWSESRQQPGTWLQLCDNGAGVSHQTSLSAAALRGSYVVSLCVWHDFSCVITVLMFPIKHLCQLPLSEVAMLSSCDLYFVFEWAFSHTVHCCWRLPSTHRIYSRPSVREVKDMSEWPSVKDVEDISQWPSLKKCKMNKSDAGHKYCSCWSTAAYSTSLFKSTSPLISQLVSRNNSQLLFRYAPPW